MSDKPPDSPADEQPLAYRAVRGGIWVALSSYWNFGFGMLITIVLARLLPVDAFGVFALAVSFASLLNLQTKLGLGYAFGQLKETTGYEVITYLKMELAAIVPGVLLILAVAAVLPASILPASAVPLMIAMALIGVLQSVGSALSTLIDKELRFGLTSVLSMVTTTLSYVPALWLATRGWGPWSLAAQNLAQTVPALAIVVYIVRHRLAWIWYRRGHFSGPLARSMVRFSLTTGLGSLAGSLLGSLDNFMVNTFAGVTALGYYDRAYRTAQWPALLFNIVNSRAAFYTYARLQDDPQRMRKAFTMLLWMIITVTAPVVLIIFITAPDLLTWLYTDRWLPSAPLLRILVLAGAVRPVWDNAGFLFNAIGRPGLTTRCVLISVATLFVAGIPLTLAFQATGTALAVCLAMLTGAVIIFYYVNRLVHVDWLRLFGGPILAAGVALAGYAVLNQVVDVTTLALPVRVILKAVYAAAAFFLLTFALQPRLTRERVMYVLNLALRRNPGGTASEG